MKIIPMSDRHVPQLARLEAICFSHPWSETALKEEIENDGACFLVAVEGAEVLGYCGMHHACGECYIDNVAVFPEHRGRGVASALLAALIEKAKLLGGEFISLEVRPTNTSAVRIYERLGFCTVGRRKNFYTDPTEDALIMTLNFSENRQI